VVENPYAVSCEPLTEEQPTVSDVTDPRLHELWTLSDFLRDNPTGFTAVTKTKIRRLERELRDEGIDTETRPVQAGG
jgi:hypothetical protein